MLLQLLMVALDNFLNNVQIIILLFLLVLLLQQYTKILPIKVRSDINITAKEICEILNREPSSFLKTLLNPPFIRFIQSLKKKMQIASNVPKCNAISNESDIFQLKKNSDNKYKCAELDTGNNSVNP